ncbi:MAG: 50S ribosomal protein L24 [Verrucomicrobiae bacterium]|nr:50S ribosomal protein L24 [Verrucomicrobiae bacterium]
MAKARIKKGDEVVVISGAARGARGKVLEVIPKKERVVVEGVRKMRKAVRKSQQHPEGGFMEREAPIHVSNVMLASRWDERRSRRAAAK